MVHSLPPDPPPAIIEKIAIKEAEQIRAQQEAAERRRREEELRRQIDAENRRRASETNQR